MASHSNTQTSRGFICMYACKLLARGLTTMLTTKNNENCLESFRKQSIKRLDLTLYF